MQASNGSPALPEAEQLRVHMYRLLARALSMPADEGFLSVLRGLEGDETPLGQAFGALSAVARNTDVAAAAEEYQDLFIGIGRGELVPYGSYYLTGFLHEKPLARLRGDMAELKIVRADEHKEPEDHGGALMDMMAGLIDGSFGARESLDVQKRFFEKHVSNWMPHFYADLEKASHARLLMPVGTIGRLFLEIEEAAFEM